MNKLLTLRYIALILTLLSLTFVLSECKKSENSIKYPLGTFPDTVLNIANINSAYDDYNMALPQLGGYLPLIFSSNRKSSGGQFDLEQASLFFLFNQVDGSFVLSSEMIDDPFLSKLINKAVTPRDDLGPSRIFSSSDGYEYLIVASENTEGNLDLFYLMNQPVYGSNLPDVEGPNPIKLLNTSFDDAYLCFDPNLDSAYFTTNAEGNFDIYLKSRPVNTDPSAWFDLDYAAPARVDSINSPDNDKCPMVYNKLMIFTSDRAGGFGGFDLYYSVFKNGNWSSPVNCGSRINSASDEYRPVIGDYPNFTNPFLIFSSNRPGGKGGFDLYFTGIELPYK